MSSHFLRKAFYAVALLGFSAAAGVIPCLQIAALGQSAISGDISGTVTDPGGAVVPGASIIITSKTTGQTRTETTTDTGTYRVTLLQPGGYTLKVSAANFETVTLDVDVQVGQVAGGDARLTIGKTTTTVNVSDQTTPLLRTDAADLTMTLSMQQIEALPNPGNDITYYAQTAPGVVMNTGGGPGGNFSAFGLPGTSNNFLINGAQQNDPFTNVNYSGPSNLLLGQNDIAQVSVITNAYGAEFGSLGGAQLNEITRSGTNSYHGNATYYFNSAILNANNWFTNHDGGSRPNSTNNQWALAVGGPIRKDKSFFFLNTEGIRFVTSTPTFVAVPNASYQSNVLAHLAAGGDYGDPATAAQVGYIQNIFNLYNNSPAVVAARAAGIISPYDPDSDAFTANPKVSLREWLITARYDQALGANDHFFLHANYDVGKQPTYVDPLYDAWSANSYQPDWRGELEETHSFSPTLTNQFLFTATHFLALFSLPDYQEANALLPYTFAVIDENFNYLNVYDSSLPQGRNETRYQFDDDVSWSRGEHTLKAGFLFRRHDISDLDAGQINNPQVGTFGNFRVAAGTNQGVPYNGTTCDPNPNNLQGSPFFCLTNGYIYSNQQLFPRGQNASCIGGACNGIPPSNPVALYALAAYVEDVWKALPNLTISAGIRFERNSNPICPTNCFSRLADSIPELYNLDGPNSADPGGTPYNQLLSYDLRHSLENYMSISPQPRIGISWLPFGVNSKTVVSGGFGMFADPFPAEVSDYLLLNPPQNTYFRNARGYTALEPGVSGFNGNGFTLNQESNANFSGPSGFAGGASFNTLLSQGHFIRPSAFSIAQRIQYPTYEEWNLQIQHQFNSTTVIQLGYVGNHGYHEPVLNSGENAYDFGGLTGFGLPEGASPITSFGQTILISSTASSNYNGFVASVIERTKWVQAQLNYTLSHALDEISNGGVLNFTAGAITGPIDPNNLSYNYGNADYDVRYNINGNYLVSLPWFGGFQIAGTVFFHAGFPFTVTDGITPANNFGFYYSAVPASYTTVPVNHHCGKQGATTNLGCFGDSLTGSPLTPYFTYANSFHDQQRNSFTGPGYFDTDVSVMKVIKLARFQGKALQLGAQLFNAFNHPNFGSPASDIAESGSGFGHITNTVGSPTGIYGSGLGGDSSVRTLQFKANLIF